MLHNEIKTYLDKLNQEQKTLVSYHGEYDIAKEIKNILTKDKNYKPTDKDIAEQMAFDFMAEYPNDNSGCGTYYGPMFILPNQQGQMVEYPSIKRVSEETLNYWAKRAKESQNLILSSRYADLVVDFSPKVINKNANIEIFQTVIDSNIAICEKSLADPLDCKAKIKRALILAIQISNKEKINKIKETIINLEKKVSTDDKPGLWGFAFKWLILDFNKKVQIAEKEKGALIEDLEERLKRVEKDTWLTENAVSLLAEHYAQEKDEENLMRVLDVLEKSLKTNERTNSDALLKMHAYEQIHEIYQKYRDKGFAKAKVESDRLSKEIGQLDLDWDNNYLVSSHLFNPLIESAVRELVKNCGGLILKPNNLGGYDRVLLGSFLYGQSNILKEVFSGISPNICFYFRLVLTEKLGMNLRNDFAHGFSKKKFFTKETSNRLFHVLICLSLVRKQNKE